MLSGQSQNHFTEMPKCFSTTNVSLKNNCYRELCRCYRLSVMTEHYQHDRQRQTSHLMSMYQIVDQNSGFYNVFYSKSFQSAFWLTELISLLFIGQLKTTELVTLSALRLLRGRRWIRAESDGELDFWPLTLTSVRSVCDPQSSGSQSQLKDVLIHIWSTLTIRRYSLMPRNIFGGSLCCTLCVLKPFAPSAFPTVTCWIKYPPPWRISD